MHLITRLTVTSQEDTIFTFRKGNSSSSLGVQLRIVPVDAHTISFPPITLQILLNILSTVYPIHKLENTIVVLRLL